MQTYFSETGNSTSRAGYQTSRELDANTTCKQCNAHEGRSETDENSGTRSGPVQVKGEMSMARSEFAVAGAATATAVMEQQHAA